MKRSMKRLIPVFISLSVMTAASAAAHDVSASQVKVYRKGASLEVWQTTPYKVAHGIDLKADAEVPDGLSPDERALHAIAQGWAIESDKGPCALTKQAFRRVHHDTQLQLRLLFTCPEGASARLASMNWLTQTPPEHFVFYDTDSIKGMKRRVVERDQVTITISD